MPKCKIAECQNNTRYKNTNELYCPMHKERIKRHGYPELKQGSHGLEKLPHPVVDDFIRQNCQKMIDKEIVKELEALGIKDVSIWNVKYRRRRLGVKKYLYGEIKKHRAWVRLQAIKKYGNKCMLCGYGLSLDVHHIIPKHKGGPHKVDNLTVLCPNCHALITRKHFSLNSQDDIPKIKKEVKKLLKSYYP